MKYKEFLSVNEGFQYSINLQYDLANTHKVDGYIPTSKSIEILRQYLENVYYDKKDKATVLIGPYGKGKSHLLLILLSLIKEDVDNKHIKKLLGKIENIDNQCAKLAREVSKNNKLIPVIVNSNSIDLNQAFLVAINDALTKADLNHLLPNTYFDAAIELIEKWKNEYEDTYKRFNKEIQNIGIPSGEVLIKQLGKYDKQAFNIFKDVHPKLTSGVEFNPLMNTDVVKLYEEVSIIVSEQTNYSGLYIVFDEFSKFIEASVSHNTNKDLKLLQDMAELANRSGKLNQIHITCITHKTINEYISKIPTNKIDQWRAVEGRFTEIYFTSSANQNYELISNVILKDDEKFKKYKLNFIDEFNEAFEIAKDKFKNLYSDGKELKESIVYGCFPLNPNSTFVLPKISERVAQNERTLFTFLCKDDKKSLVEFIKKESKGFNLINIDLIFDYFQPLFKKEVFNEYIHDIWMKVDTALNRCSDENEKKVLKALGIIYITNDFTMLPPVGINIRECLFMDKITFDSAFNSLCDKGVILQRKSNSYVDFTPIIGVDIKQRINQYKETKVRNINIASELDKIVVQKYILPKRYNDDYKMVRFFKRKFISFDQLMSYKDDYSLISDAKSDGVLLDIIFLKEEERELIIEKLLRFESKRVLAMLPKEQFRIEDDIREYLAIKQLLEDKELLNQDLAIENYLSILLDDKIDSIKSYLEWEFNEENENVELIGHNLTLSKLRKEELSKLTSQICYEKFYNTPKVNSELINKNSISAPILKARNKIVELILSKEYIDYEYSGSSVENTIFRATVKNKGLLNIDKNTDLECVINEIKAFVKDAENANINFGKLYSDLMDDTKAIGIRKGLIPIYIAYVLKDYTEEAVIYLDGRTIKEVQLDYETLNNINEEPHKYLFKLDIGTNEKTEYINQLASLFEDYIDNNKYRINKYVELLKSMQIWFQSLGKYARTHDYISYKNENVSDNIKDFRKRILKFDINARSFIFKDLLEITKAQTFEMCINEITIIKNDLDNFDSRFKAYLNEQTKIMFNKNYEGSCSQAFILWGESLSVKQKQHLYDINTNSVLKLLDENITSDDILMNKLAYIATNLNIADWNDDTFETYEKELMKIKDTLENYTEEVSVDSEAELVKIGILDNGGSIIEKTFNKEDINPISMTLLNSIEEVIDEYADSIDENQKRNILMNILQKYI